MTQLAQGFGLNLADSFTRYVEQLAHFLQGMIGLFTNTEALAQNLFLTWRKISQYGGYLFGKLGIDHFLSRSYGFLVLNEVTKAGVFLITNGCFKRNRLLGNFQNFLDMRSAISSGVGSRPSSCTR